MHVLQANAPPDFHALGASNTHPILSRWVTSPGYGVGMGSDGIVLSLSKCLLCGTTFLWTDGMAADNFCVSGLYMSRQKNAFCTELALAHVLQANGPPNFYAFRASNDHPVQRLPLNLAHIL